MATEPSKPSAKAERLDRVLLEFAATIATTAQSAVLIADQLMKDLQGNGDEVEFSESVEELRGELEVVRIRCVRLWNDVHACFPELSLSQGDITRLAIALSRVHR